MKRHTLVTLGCLGALLLGLSATPGLAQTKTLRVVAHADVKILDPTFTTAYITRNFGYMVYDMLFGRDDKGVPHPQMVEKYTTSKDGKQWSFTLRPGLKFSDGSPVTAADAVASIERWASKDSIGRAMAASGPQWQVVNASTFTLTLKEPFGLVLDGLSKPSGFPPVINLLQNLTNNWQWLVDVVTSFSVITHFEGFQKGVLDSRDVIFFLSVIGFSLFTTSVILRTHRTN